MEYSHPSPGAMPEVEVGFYSVIPGLPMVKLVFTINLF